MDQAQYNNRNFNVIRAYFTGGETLQQGQILCYQQDPATATTTGTPTTTHTAASKGFPFDVEMPNADNVQAFAGVVGESSIGKVGPCYIDVIVPQPGDILQVLVNSTASDLAVGNLLDVDDNIPTASSATSVSTGSGNGGLGNAAIYGASVTFASNATSAALSAVAAGVGAVRARLLESLASVSASAAGARNLRWVQFI